MTPTIALIWLTAFTAGILLSYLFGPFVSRIYRIRRQLKALAAVLYAAKQWADSELALRYYNATHPAHSGYRFDEDAHRVVLDSDWAEQRLLGAIRAAEAKGLNLNLFSRLS